MKRVQDSHKMRQVGAAQAAQAAQAAAAAEERRQAAPGKCLPDIAPAVKDEPMAAAEGPGPEPRPQLPRLEQALQIPFAARLPVEPAEKNSKERAIFINNTDFNLRIHKSDKNPVKTGTKKG